MNTDLLDDETFIFENNELTIVSRIGGLSHALK